ncbi:MAG: hypothetical protein P1U58_11170 [Verrucomicrobiales bacterium]|nr:hypothetical protein [Verrucomicrobiales bacterium]
MKKPTLSLALAAGLILPAFSAEVKMYESTGTLPYLSVEERV